LKLSFSVFSLTGCSGCISTLIALDVFPQFLERTKIVYFPFISDEKNIKNCDVAKILENLQKKFTLSVHVLPLGEY